MSEYAPPPGPPPPKLPAGWVAQWNEQYQEWFYVNIYTKKSQWEKPIEPVYPLGEPFALPPEGPPPSYNSSGAKPVAEVKTDLSSNNPYNPNRAAGGSSQKDIGEDEALARRLQAEEDARAFGGSSHGSMDRFYSPPQVGASPSQYPPGGYSTPQPFPGQDLQPRVEDKGGKSKGGFLGKLLGKASSHQRPQGYPQQQPQHYPMPPQALHGYGPQQGYYGPGGYPAHQAHGQSHRSKGLGAGGAAALGVGGGLLGGMLLADALNDQDAYEDGFQDGADFGGGDFGGGF